ncbi:MAG: hypothetical protein DPW09_04940 [Anaerolineae bacterium]|nr:hypothetical protein [Anaerolineae bacterium]
MLTPDPRWRKLWRNLGWYVLLVAISIVLVRVDRVPLLWLPWLVALVGGVWLVWSQLKVKPEGLDEQVRLDSYLKQTLAYKAQIDQAVKAAAQAGQRTHLQTLGGQIDTWTETIQDLVERISKLRRDEIIRRDVETVPAAIADLESRLQREKDPAIRAQLERTLANRRKQLASLDQLQNTVKRAEIQIESTLSLLGTIYSQILTGQSTSHVADTSRLSADVDEEVRLLQDQLEALREVKLGEEQ